MLAFGLQVYVFVKTDGTDLLFINLHPLLIDVPIFLLHIQQYSNKLQTETYRRR
jgi:hypothetical protein